MKHRHAHSLCVVRMQKTSNWSKAYATRESSGPATSEISVYSNEILMRLKRVKTYLNLRASYGRLLEFKK